MRGHASAMKTVLVLTDSLSNELLLASRHHLETAGVLLASIVATPSGGVRLLGRSIYWVPDSAYVHRESDSLSIASHGYVPALAEAERIGATAIWLHTHPGNGSAPLPSTHDLEVDRQLSDVFRLRTGSDFYGYLIISPTEKHIAFTGQVDSENEPSRAIDALWFVGDRLIYVPTFAHPMGLPSEVYDRNVRAFGPIMQEVLDKLHVGIVGCGGTGSAVAEQMVRLGARHFTLIDPKALTPSNVTRVYGSTPRDIGTPKVTILAAHLNRIAPDVVSNPVQAAITNESAAKALLDCDIVFGCSDDNAGRMILSRLATFFLIPIIDCGVLLTSDKNELLTGIDGRVTTLIPGQACLVCRGRIDLRRAATELLTPEERTVRENEGYAPALGNIEPAVITYTTVVAATAVAEFLERFIGYGPNPRPSEVLLRCHDREISTNITAPRERHYCHPSSGKIGNGMTVPFLEQTWVT